MEDIHNLLFSASVISVIGSVRLWRFRLCKMHGRPRSAYRGADRYLARPTSRCILFDGDNISFDASLVIYRGVQK